MILVFLDGTLRASFCKDDVGLLDEGRRVLAMEGNGRRGLEAGNEGTALHERPRLTGARGDEEESGEGLYAASGEEMEG